MRRVLSLWQPWATLTVAFNGAGTTPPTPAKRVETRHFRPRYSLPIDVAIHAAKRWNRDESERIKQWPFWQCLTRAGYSVRDPSKDYSFSDGREYHGDRAELLGEPLRRIPLGAIVGVARIVSVVPSEKWVEGFQAFRDGPEHDRCMEEMALGNYEPGRFGWLLADAIALPSPIPFRGRQDVLYELDADTNAAIDAQLQTTHSEAP